MGTPKKVFFETKLSALSNVRLTPVRHSKPNEYYCIAHDKYGNRKASFDGYYQDTELTKRTA